MKRELRIIDDVCRVANVDKDGKIINVVGDYQKSEKIRHEREMELIRQEKEIEEKEEIHEILYGKRYRRQIHDATVKGPDQYRKNLLQKKVAIGIVDETSINIRSSKELLDNWARERHFYNYEEYLNIIALGRGFTCYGEYQKVWSHYYGMPSPIKENRIDTRFIGVYIA